ncbi:hypothetical protein CLOBOL_01623 [Enterocloster bolteae ATCC BAA-613]|uniref:Uncharacterized protein n=1 Tax=Enterocloster bolteae (strain ATCC BAA-613 / DSM 15670 / CCUG 46953 / JCM 12243 / WAL 16351) TaxID=411902 RepID=A8RLH5_ENTBW|nr:hypothetical protein CLOBOL_01623 [Enterocloster bolteae ATCC BAA-613]
MDFIFRAIFYKYISGLTECGNVTYTKLYLDGTFRQLKREIPDKGAAAKYDTQGLPG